MFLFYGEPDVFDAIREKLINILTDNKYSNKGSTSIR